MESSSKDKKIKLKLVTSKKDINNKVPTLSTKNKRNQIYEDGYYDGYSCGYMDGFNEGREDGRKQLLKHLASFIDAFNFEDEDF